jgi:hypothetical protein
MLPPGLVRSQTCRGLGPLFGRWTAFRSGPRGQSLARTFATELSRRQRAAASGALLFGAGVVGTTTSSLIVLFQSQAHCDEHPRAAETEEATAAEEPTGGVADEASEEQEQVEREKVDETAATGSLERANLGQGTSVVRSGAKQHSAGVWLRLLALMRSEAVFFVLSGCAPNPRATRCAMHRGMVA